MGRLRSYEATMALLCTIALCHCGTVVRTAAHQFVIKHAQTTEENVPLTVAALSSFPGFLARANSHTNRCQKWTIYQFIVKSARKHKGTRAPHSGPPSIYIHTDVCIPVYIYIYIYIVTSLNSLQLMMLHIYYV